MYKPRKVSIICHFPLCTLRMPLETGYIYIVSLYYFSVSPNFYSTNLLYIAKCYYALGDKEKALHYATKTREYYMKTPDDIQASGPKIIQYRFDSLLLKRLNVSSPRSWGGGGVVHWPQITDHCP